MKGRRMNVVPMPEKQEEVSFEDFWVLYPRHEAKKAARKAWEKIDASVHVEILTALAVWRRVLLDRELNFRPLPASWLNGERWEDELPNEYKPRAEARPAERIQEKRSPMPDHVRALIAKLRA